MFPALALIFIAVALYRIVFVLPVAAPSFFAVAGAFVGMLMVGAARIAGDKLTRKEAMTLVGIMAFIAVVACGLLL